MTLHESSARSAACIVGRHEMLQNASFHNAVQVGPVGDVRQEARKHCAERQSQADYDGSLVTALAL